MLSAHFSTDDLIQAGQTWARHRVSNEPKQPETWAALRQLCADILEPVTDCFRRPTITYGFASAALTRLIPGRISPRHDQHSGHELKANGTPICDRLGQSVDFIVDGTKSEIIARWIVEQLPYDRLYFYGSDRPIHVSVGPQNSRSIVAMLPDASGRRIPRRVTLNWLQQFPG